MQETKQHGAVRFPFNLYPCTIPGDFQQVALHWHESMELVFVKQGMGLVQVGVVTYPAYRGDIFIFAQMCIRDRTSCLSTQRRSARCSAS